MNRFEAELLEAFRTRYRHLLRRTSAPRRSLPDGIGDAVAEFKDGFQPSDGRGRARPITPAWLPRASSDATSAKTLATE